MDLMCVFFPFVILFGLAIINDPLTERFLEDWENDR